MQMKFLRTLRTASSERFVVAAESSEELASIDIHYLSDGNVLGTVVVLNDALLEDSNLQQLLEGVDETLLPMASLDQQNLRFTVIHGRIFGEFENAKT